MFLLPLALKLEHKYPLNGELMVILKPGRNMKSHQIGHIRATSTLPCLKLPIPFLDSFNNYKVHPIIKLNRLFIMSFLMFYLHLLVYHTFSVSSLWQCFLSCLKTAVLYLVSFCPTLKLFLFQSKQTLFLILKFNIDQGRGKKELKQ